MRNNANFVLGIILIAIVNLGLAGNLTSLITWTKGRRCRKFPGTTYLRALAISDSLVLCFPGAQFAILMTFDIELKDLSEVTCKLYDAMGHFCALVSTWLVLSMTLQRTIAVCAPLKSATWSSKRREIMVICTLVALFFALNLPFGLRFRLGKTSIETEMNSNRSGNNTNITTAFDTNFTENLSVKWKCFDDPAAFLHKHHVWIVDIVLLFVAPFTVLIACNVILLIKIFHRHDAIDMPCSMSQKRYGRDFGFASMTARVVTISVTHIVLVGPVAITGMIPGFPLNIYIMMHVFFFLNHSVNFVFYSLVGTSFRRDWLELLFCKHAHRGVSVTSMTDSRF